MSKKFIMNENVSFVVLPGVGKVRAGTVLEGDEYAKFSPRYLTEVPEMPVATPLETTKPAAPQVLTEPTPAVVVPPQVEMPVETDKQLLVEDQATPTTESAPPQPKARNSKPPKANG